MSTSEVAAALADGHTLAVDGARGYVTGVDSDGAKLTVVIRWPLGEEVEVIDALV